MGTLKRSVKIITLVTILLTLITAAANQKPSQAHTVIIKNFAFVPDHLAVAVGDTIVWKNEDSTPHTATADTEFDSKQLNTGQSFTFVARKAGSFPYICTFHPYMKGELVVQ
jgi:plastocyanin